MMGESFDELVSIFLASSRSILTALENAYLERDLETFLRHAHSLRSSSADLGGLELSQIAAQLEQDADQGKLPESADYLDALNLELDRVEELLLQQTSGAEAARARTY